MTMRFLLFALLLLAPSLAHAQATVVTSCGSTTLSAGTSHFVTVDTNGQSCQSGAGSGTGPTSVWSATDAAANGMTLSNGGLTVTTASNAYQTIRGTTSKTSGKVYIEFKSGATLFGADDPGFGLADSGFNPVGYLSQTPISVGLITGGTHTNIGNPAALTSNYTTAVYAQINDVWAMAIDLTAGKIWLAQNNVWFGSGNPATGANPMASFTGALLGATYFPAMTIRFNNAPIWTLQPTAASQKYAAPAGFTAWDGAGGATGCSQATAYLARATGEVTHAADLTTLICGLVSDGVWAKLDALYVLAQQTQADARLNLVSASYPLTGSPTFTAYKGFSAFAGVSLLATGFDPSSAPSPHMLSANASFGAWLYDAPDIATVQGGTYAGAGSVVLAANFGAGGTQYYCYIAYQSTPNFAPPPATAGLYGCDKASSAGSALYYNAVLQLANDAGNTQPFTAGTPITIGGAGGYPATANTLSETHFGASLGSAGQTALYNRLRTYLTSVGVP